MVAQEAHAAARRMLYTMHSGRNRVTFRIPATYLYLLPGDIVNVPLGGFTYKVAVTNRKVNELVWIELEGIEVNYV